MRPLLVTLLVPLAAGCTAIDGFGFHFADAAAIVDGGHADLRTDGGPVHVDAGRADGTVPIDAGRPDARTPPDAMPPPGTVGSPCVQGSTSSCDPGLTCFTDIGNGHNFPGGYCSKVCTKNTDCPNGSDCVAIDSTSYCLLSCSLACRASYACCGGVAGVLGDCVPPDFPMCTTL